MDKIAETEVLLNVLNTAIAYAFSYCSPNLKELQDIRYDFYHKKDKDNTEILEKILAIKVEVLKENTL